MRCCNVCNILKYNPENTFKCVKNNCEHYICRSCISDKTPEETNWSFCSGIKGICDNYTYILCPDHYGKGNWDDFKQNCTVRPSNYKPERIEPCVGSKCSICLDAQEGVTTFGNKSKEKIVAKKYGFYKKRKFNR